MLVLRYLCKRVLSTIPVLFLVSLVVFSMIHLTAGSPGRAMLGPEASDEQVAALEEVMASTTRFPSNMSTGFPTCCTGISALPSPTMSRCSP